MRGGAFVRETSADTEASLFSTDEFAGSEMHQMASFTLGAGADSSGVKLGAGGRDVVNPFKDRGGLGGDLLVRYELILWLAAAPSTIQLEHQTHADEIKELVGVRRRG